MVRLDDGLNHIPLAVHDGDYKCIVPCTVLVCQGGSVLDEQHGQVFVAIDCSQVEWSSVGLHTMGYGKR